MDEKCHRKIKISGLPGILLKLRAQMTTIKGLVPTIVTMYKKLHMEITA